MREQAASKANREVFAAFREGTKVGAEDGAAGCYAPSDNPHLPPEGEHQHDLARAWSDGYIEGYVPADSARYAREYLPA